ncbi:hypothetical protein BK127_07985 [Paenibacillus sp. FSL H7-0331]|nr:hypothetical protein BK127_07985 [Paenibacillus sp. FSL H7-0331]
MDPELLEELPIPPLAPEDPLDIPLDEPDDALGADTDLLPDEELEEGAVDAEEVNEPERSVVVGAGLLVVAGAVVVFDLLSATGVVLLALLLAAVLLLGDGAALLDCKAFPALAAPIAAAAAPTASPAKAPVINPEDTADSRP